MAVESVVRPDGGSAEGRCACRIEVMTFDKCVVDHDDSVTPVRMPTPTGPASPATTQEKSDVNSRAKREEETRCSSRIVPVRIRIVDRRSPEPYRIVCGYINDFRTHRLDDDDRLARLGRRGYRLLRR